MTAHVKTDPCPQMQAILYPAGYNARFLAELTIPITGLGVADYQGEASGGWRGFYLKGSRNRFGKLPYLSLWSPDFPCRLIRLTLESATGWIRFLSLFGRLF